MRIGLFLFSLIASYTAVPISAKGSAGPITETTPGLSQELSLYKRGDLDDDDLMVLMEAFKKNPNATMMDIFKAEFQESYRGWKSHPQWIITVENI